MNRIAVLHGQAPLCTPESALLSDSTESADWPRVAFPGLTMKKTEIKNARRKRDHRDLFFMFDPPVFLKAFLPRPFRNKKYASPRRGAKTGR